MNRYIRPVSGQRLGRHVPAATVTHAKGEKRGVAYAVRSKELKKKGIGTTSLVDSWQSVLYWNLEGRTRGRETEESPLLISVSR
jgi:hypothetical protein